MAPPDPLHQLRSHFSELRLRKETTAGRIYTGRDSHGNEVTVAVLAGPPASDPAARDAFADAVWRHSVGPAGRVQVISADLAGEFPWAAARTPPGQDRAERSLGEVLDRLAAAPGAEPLVPSRRSPAGPEPALPLPVPPGSAAPAKSGRAWLTGPGGPWPWLLGAAGGVLLVLVVAAAIGGVQALRAGSDSSPVGSGQPPGGGDPDLPQLRQVEPVGILGPTFGSGEPADAVAFVGWPFAFRTPPGWQCFEERLDELPDAEFYRCEGRPGSEQQAGTVLWECPSTCAEDERQVMLRGWIEDSEFVEQWEDAPTYFVETGRDRDGLYTVSLGHFAAAEPGGPLRWLVGVYVESPVETRADVQKILNDIVSQATA